MNLILLAQVIRCYHVTDVVHSVNFANLVLKHNFLHRKLEILRLICSYVLHLSHRQNNIKDVFSGQKHSERYRWELAWILVVVLNVYLLGTFRRFIDLAQKLG